MRVVLIRGTALACAGALCVAVIAPPQIAGVRFNWTASMPVGLYSIGPPIVRRGEISLVCLPPPTAHAGRERGYLPGGSCALHASPVGKRIAATPGDMVELSATDLAVNGERISTSALRTRDSLARPLSHWPLGRHSVGPSEVWLIGVDDDRSWDSRYFGPVPVSSVIASLRPIATLSLDRP